LNNNTPDNKVIVGDGWQLNNNTPENKVIVGDGWVAVEQ
jgi:hypothetical protein